MLCKAVHDIGSWGFLLNFVEISSTLHHGLCDFCAVSVASDVILSSLVHEMEVWHNSAVSPAVHLQTVVSPGIPSRSHWALHPLAS